MSWAEIKKAVNSDLGTPLDKALFEYEADFIRPSNNVGVTIIDTEKNSNTNNTSVVIGSWTSPYTGKLKMLCSLKSNMNPGYGTISMSTNPAPENVPTPPPWVSGTVIGWNGSNKLTTSYVSYVSDEGFVTKGTTYYFHLSGAESSYKTSLNLLQLLFDAGVPIFRPVLRSNNFDIPETESPEITLTTGSGTIYATYTGKGQASLISSSTTNIYYITVDSGSERTLTISPNSGAITMLFKKSLKIKGNSGNCVWFVSAS